MREATKRETIKFFSIVEKNAPIGVMMSGVSICDKNHHWIRENPTVSIIEYVFGGQGTLLINNRKIAVKEDDVYILPAGVPHEYFSNPDDPWRKYFMNLSGNIARSLIVNFSLDHKFVFHAPSLKPLFKGMIKTAFSDLSEAEKQSKLLSLYFEILHKLYILDKESQNSSEAILLKRYLDENSDRIISNAELADHIYRSQDYCLKLFKREFGATPYEYQINNKLNIACSLLQHTDKSVQEISETVGYQNPHYFTSMFKTRLSITPTKYRKKFN